MDDGPDLSADVRNPIDQRAHWQGYRAPAWRTTSAGLPEGCRHFLVAALLIANVINIGADLAAMAAASSC